LVVGLTGLSPVPRRPKLAVALGAGSLALVVAWAGGPAEPEVRRGGHRDLSTSERTTLLVGIDGMTWSAILPLVRRGELPTIERLMAEGSYGVLHSLPSTRPSTGQRGYWSPVVWTSIATGVGPAVHGIEDFNLPDPDGRTALAASHHRTSPAFWNLFPRYGQRVGVVGWWGTWPAEEIDGVIASSSLGLRGPKRQGREPGTPPSVSPGEELPRLVHPEVMLDELMRFTPSSDETERLVHDRIFRLDRYPLDLGYKRDVIYAVAGQDRFYLEVARHLLQTRELPLLAVYFEGPDVVSHHFWRFRSDPTGSLAPGYEFWLPDGFDEHTKAVDRYYRLVDEYLALLIEELPETATVVVCSDHGFREEPGHALSATHSGQGVLLARGPGIERNNPLNLSLRGSLQGLRHGRVDVLDLLPTLLYLHGLPIAETLEGEILTRLFTRELVRERPVIRVDAYDARSPGASDEGEGGGELDEEYQRRLRALGYID
ncbi:MAG: alkaline phosphatase family protein, partial [Gemmatimonadota bacterium]